SAALESAARERPDSAAPDVVRSGVDGDETAGSDGVHAGKRRNSQQLTSAYIPGIFMPAMRRAKLGSDRYVPPGLAPKSAERTWGAGPPAGRTRCRPPCC